MSDDRPQPKRRQRRFETEAELLKEIEKAEKQALKFEQRAEALDAEIKRMVAAADSISDPDNRAAISDSIALKRERCRKLTVMARNKRDVRCKRLGVALAEFRTDTLFGDDKAVVLK